MDAIDLYQLHIHDPHTPIEETLRALDDLIHQGKVRYIGCSQLSAWQTCEAIWTSRMLGLNAFVSVQPYYNVLKRDVEEELVPLCKAYGLGIIPYFPLESGFLTGKYRPGQPVPEGTRFAGRPSLHRLLSEKNFAMLTKLEQFAESRGRRVGELAIAWLLANPRVSTVIAGATTPEQVTANAKSENWKLTPEDLKEIDAITRDDETA
jgi:aryl-alcohol dehydrogenase-like predicted oxidoreductase